MGKRMGKGKRKREKSWKEKEEGKNEMCDGTVAPAESCANSETSPLPSPSSCQVVPQPLGRAQLSKKRGRGVEGVVVLFSRKCLIKNSLPKNGQSSPLSWPLKIAEIEGGHDDIPTCLL